MIYFTGCTSSRIVSASNLPPKSSRYDYIIHSEKAVYLLGKESKISNDTLSGKIKKTYNDNSYGYESWNEIHLYLSSDSLINIDNGEYLNVPLSNISKTELHEINKKATRAIIAIPLACLLGGLIILGWTGIFKWILVDIWE